MSTLWRSSPAALAAVLAAACTDAPVKLTAPGGDHAVRAAARADGGVVFVPVVRRSPLTVEYAAREASTTGATGAARSVRGGERLSSGGCAAQQAVPVAGSKKNSLRTAPAYTSTVSLPAVIVNAAYTGSGGGYNVGAFINSLMYATPGKLWGGCLGTAQFGPSYPATLVAGPVDPVYTNSQKDALRHAYWQCELTKELGANFAERWGYAHETESTDRAGTLMDLHNNAIGRQVGTSGDMCSIAVTKVWQLGRLILNSSEIRITPGTGTGPTPPPPGNDS